MLGLFDDFTPRFVKRYAELHAQMTRAFRDYVAEYIAAHPLCPGAA